MLNCSGVYKIENIKNGKVYIGSARNLKRRRGEHLSFLRKGKHPNRHLQYAYNLDGTDYFRIITIEQVTEENTIELKLKLKEREQYWKDHYKSYDDRYGYDIQPVADSRLGMKHTEETKIKIRLSKKGKCSGENNSMYGKKQSEESKQKNSKSHKGKKASGETKQKMSLSRKGRISNRKGVKLSKEIVQKMVLGRKLSKEKRMGEKFEN